MIDPRVTALCSEFGIEIVPKHRYPEPGQTRAVETMARIIRRYGVEHMRMVMTTLRETANNHALLDEAGLWMASDMVLVRGIDRIDSAWLDLWDRVEVGKLQFMTQSLAGIVPQRYALGGMVYERIYKEFGPDAGQSDLFDDARTAA
jgi:hypothetical protein